MRQGGRGREPGAQLVEESVGGQASAPARGVGRSATGLMDAERRARRRDRYPVSSS
jgi:hypothetical protein